MPTPSAATIAKTTTPAAPTTALGTAATQRATGAHTDSTTSSTAVPTVTYRLRTRDSRTMPMFSPLVTISGPPRSPASTEVTPSPRTVRVTSCRPTGRSTASAVSIVCPAASAIAPIENNSSGTIAGSRSSGAPNGKGSGSASSGPGAGGVIRPATAATTAPATMPSRTASRLRACLEMVGVSGWSTRLGCSIVVGMQERPRRYPSDTSDAQWVVIEPLLPPLARRGRPVAHARRDVLDAILYVVRTGCAWRALPVDFPPWQTVYWYFNQWEQQKVTEKILPVVRGQLRIAEGRDPEPSAGIIDSQSVKGADTVGQDSRGYDAGKKTGGRKRFIVTDTLGLLLTTMVCSASVQDRDGAKPILLNLYLRTRVRFVYADAGFAGRLLDWAATILQTTIEIIRKPPEQRGFTVLPRRWVVERTLAWLTAHRRLARDYERHPTTSEAMIRWAAINTITRRIARGYPATRQQKHTTPSTH